jgi:hypothetical protein
LLAGLSIFLRWNATRTFDFFDHSAFIDAGWRMSRGQRIYVDFFYTAGPIHPAMHALSFLVFGFGMVAIVGHLAIVNALVSGAMFSIVRRAWSTGPSLALTGIASLAFFGPISHPWYDLNAILWLALALAVDERTRVTGTSIAGVRVGAFVCGLLLAFSFHTKANIGAASIGLIGPLLLMGPHGRSRAVFAISGGLAGLVGVAACLSDPSAYYYDAFVAYRTGSRFSDLERLEDMLLTTTYLPQFCAQALVLHSGGPALAERARRPALIGAALIGVGMASAWTGSTFLPSYTMLSGLALCYLALIVQALPPGLAPGSARLARGLFLVSAVLVAAWAGWRSVRVEAWRWRSAGAKPVGSDYALKHPTLEGWRCDERIGKGLDLALEAVAVHVPPADSLFVFPDATVAYAALGRDSFPGVPFIFHRDVVPPPGKITEDMVARFKAQPPRWILLHHRCLVEWCDVPKFLQTLGLSTLVGSQYRVVWNAEGFELLQLDR